MPAWLAEFRPIVFLASDRAARNQRVLSLSSSMLIISLLFLMGSSPLLSRNLLSPTFYAQSEYPALVSENMKRPGFWIGQHPSPDSLIMDQLTLQKYNQRVFRQGHATRIDQHAKQISGKAVRTMINDAYYLGRAVAIYDSIGQRVSDTFWVDLKRNMNLPALPRTAKVRFALPIRFTAQRLAPSWANLNKVPLDLEFDELQNSGYDIGYPTVLYHDSADGKWAFGASGLSIGWYRLEDLIIVPHSVWSAYLQPQEWIVSTAVKNDLYRNAQATDYYGYIRMGVKLPLIAEHENYYEVWLPSQDRQSGFIAKREANVGYLPYTARNIYLQAFKLLNTPYGWGDKGGEYDCSSLLKQIFACFGVVLPRNGASQEKAGKPVHSFAEHADNETREQAIARYGKAATTLLRMPGHIMLYLGSIDGQAYALHDIWARRSLGSDSQNEIYLINKTVVSDLYLNEDSIRGSLLKRLTGIGDLRF